MAPEQLEGRQVDARTDVFGFGALLYEMLTGRQAFDGQSQASVIAGILGRDPDPISRVQPICPRLLDRVVAKCLAKDPDNRWQTMRPSRGRRSRSCGTPAGSRLPRCSVLRLDVVTPETTDPVSFAVSPDGRQLVFASRADGAPKLWLRPLDQPTAHPLAPVAILQTSFDESEAQFSPDGRWIAYVSSESGRGEIHIMRFPGPANKWVVSSAGGDQPRWRRDGKELLYIAADGRLMAVPIDLHAESVDIGSAAALFATRLTNVGFPSHQYAVSADGRRFVLNAGIDESSVPPITMVQNWTADLGKSTSRR